MKREMLKELGLEDALIDKIMAENGKDIQAANAKAEGYKTDAMKVAELQKQLDDLNSQNMTDIEKANKRVETSEARVVELEKTLKAMQTKTALAEKGIVGEQAEKLIKADGSLDFEILGQIITERESAAATKKEQEIAKNASNPGGGSAGGTDNKTEAEKIAETLIASNKVDSTKANSVIANYL